MVTCPPELWFDRGQQTSTCHTSDVRIRQLEAGPTEKLLRHQSPPGIVLNNKPMGHVLRTEPCAKDWEEPGPHVRSTSHGGMGNPHPMS